MPSRDTSPKMARLQEQAYVQLGMGGRLRIALELSDLAHAFAVAGIRRRYPQLSEDDARRQLAETLYGSATDVRR